MITGDIYNKDDLNKVKLSEVREYMGEDFGDRISTGGLFVDPEKFAEEARTLPRPDARLLARVFNNIGIQPVAKEASHDSTGISKDDLKRLAEYHRSKADKTSNVKTAEAKTDEKPIQSRGAAIAWLAKSLQKK